MRGQLVAMEAGQVHDLKSELEHGLPPFIRAPEFALRGPASYVCLVAEKRWSKLAVLDFGRECGKGWLKWALRWDCLGLPRPGDRQPVSIPASRCSSTMERTWQDMSDLLRRLQGTIFV